MARGTSSTQSAKNNKIIDRLHNIIRAGGINNYVLRVDFIAILYLMRRFEEEIKSHQDDFIGEIFNKSVILGKKVDADLYRFSRLNEITDATQLQKFINDEVIPFYRELPDIVSYPSNKKPSIYETNFYKYNSEFFRDATISKLKSGRLKEVISLVSEIESSTILSDDFLGDAVESAFANSTSAERKQMGLFRTPRHIRDLMVEMAKPTIKDKIYDPAVGTGGFLISAKKYIFDNLDLSSASENDLQRFYFNGLGGMEQDMFLHRFAMMVALTNQVNPLNIEEGDSLGNFDFVRDRESYSLILTNPPFGGEKNQDHYSNLWAMNSSETTVLFLKLMHELLTLNGRCLTVVSEGMNTWSDATSLEMRRIISEDNTLEAVISLPQGVFQNPKGGIGPKTSIYFFRKTKPQKDHKVFFYQIENDGYSIGTNRKEIEGSQIPDLLEMWNLYINGKYDEVISNNCYLIPITKITSDPIYSFNISSYLSGISQILVEDYQKQINKINRDFQSKVKAITSGSMEATEIEKYKEPFETIAEDVAGTASVFNSLDWKFKDNLNLIDDHIKQNLEKLNSISIPNKVMASMATISEYRDLNENILKRGNQYSLISLGDLVKKRKNKVKPFENPEQEYVVLGVSNTIGIFINERKLGKEINQPYYPVKKNDFCYNPYRINVGSIGLNKHEYRDQIISGAYSVFSCDESKIIPEFLNEIFNSDKFLTFVNEKANGAVRMNFKFEYLENFKIPLPPLYKQREVVKKLISYNQITNSSKLIEKNYIIEVPETGNKRKLSEFIEDSLYGISSALSLSGELPVLRMNNITSNAQLNMTDLKYTNEKLSEERILKKGDFLFNRTNSIDLVGKSTVFNTDKLCTYAGYLIRLKLNDQLSPKYLAYLFATERYRILFRKIAKQAGNQANINAKQLANIYIDYCPTETQQKIVAEIDQNISTLIEVANFSKSIWYKKNNLMKKIWNE